MLLIPSVGLLVPKYEEANEARLDTITNTEGINPFWSLKTNTGD